MKAGGPFERTGKPHNPAGPIEIVDLTEDNLAQAPEWGSHPFSCKYCLYWEYPEECVDPAAEEKELMLQKKHTWFRRTRNKFGNCGKLINCYGKPIGYAQFAPPEFLPNAVQYHAGPASADAVLISCLFIPDKEFHNLGLGRRLLESIITELRKKGIPAVETFGRKGRSNNPSGPAEFYLKNGFRVYKDNGEFPLMRLKIS